MPGKKNPFSVFNVPKNTAPSDKRAAAKSKKKKKTTTKSKASSSVRKTTTASARRTKHKGSHGETAYGQRMSKKSPIKRKKK